MVSLFDTDWDGLSLEHVRVFFADAGEEGLTWEAKSDGALAARADPLHRGSIEKAVCALANQLGGYVILGAERRTKRSDWELPGVVIPGDEPELWLGDAVRSLSPIPQHRLRAWSADGGDGERVVAVIEVLPLTRTPCMTRDGRVFERVSGASPPVTDPVRLHELIQRGRLARSRAETCVSQRISVATPPGGLFTEVTNPGVHLAIGFAATSYEPNVPGRLFTTSFMEYLDDRFAQRLFIQPNLTWKEPPRSVIEQRAVTRTAHGEAVLRWQANADAEGTVLIRGRLAADAAGTTALFPVLLQPAWELGVELVRALGGYGEAFWQFGLWPRYSAKAEDSLYARLPADTTISRWTGVEMPDDPALDSVRRELERAAGYWVLDDHLAGQTRLQP